MATEQELFEFSKTPEPVVETPAVETPPAEPAPAPEPPVAVEPTPAPDSVPPWRLREEAEARRAAEDRARMLETRLAEITAHLQQQQVPQKNDFFENPDAATQALIQRHIQPYVEENRRTLMALSKTVASTKYGEDKVDEAEKAFLAAHAAQTLDTMDYERVVQAPNRYEAAVQWHRRQTVLTSVGDDPAAWFDKQLEVRLADPKFQASLLEKVRGSVAAKPGTVKLPPSLSKAPGASGNDRESEGDMSDQSLFANAMRR